MGWGRGGCQGKLLVNLSPCGGEYDTLGCTLTHCNKLITGAAFPFLFKVLNPGAIRRCCILHADVFFFFLFFLILSCVWGFENILPFLKGPQHRKGYIRAVPCALNGAGRESF